ncbi:MAG: aldehyde ferredoxin oxidoreductase family protein [Dehalococcoidales bacterium]|nr:aldehyde ferredoxin oxidoreductase family protein [Dehalococcoidales bacterium]
MGHGYMGKMLWVDLSKRKITEEPIDEKTMRNFLGGYGLGARVLFSRQKGGVDPLGPEATLGFVTGILTGTDALGGSRYVVVGKSPLTGGWGDANSGGNFGPYLKFAGYDAVFFTGIADKPVYLLIDNGKAELKDASNLWGKDTFETQDILRAAHGKDLEVACVGPSGEKKCLIAAVMNNKGRAAGRSGLGAVMGSKNLKAVAVRGNMKIPVADEKKSAEMRKRHLASMGPRVSFMRDFGTSGLFSMSCESDDAPCKNWAGTAVVDFTTYKKLSGEEVLKKRQRGWGCWHCPVACGGIMKPNASGEFTYSEEAHKPEYETLAMFGSNLLNDDLDSIIKLNDICNRYGLDTISAGAVIAFVLECYENGILTKKDTDGLEMKWGNAKAIVAMTEKLAKREGFGNIIADGVKKAAERIGKGSEKYAMHIAGQEVPAHDPRGGIMFAIGYGASPTPGRHTQGGEGPFPPGALPDFDRMSLKGRGKPHMVGVALTQVYNAAGVCMIVIGDAYGHFDHLIEALQTITGWDLTRDELIKTGIRIETMRQAFNVREGLTSPWKFPDRMLGIPPKQVGPRKGITLNPDELFTEYYQVIGWDPKTGKPSKQTLLELGLDDVAKALYK